MTQHDPRSGEAPLPAQLFADDPNEGSGKDVEREQMLASLHARMFGGTQRVCLGRFALGKRRGAGAMGVVYEAHDPDLDRKVALKVLRSTALDPSGVDRFTLEARALAKLRHPNVVTVYEVGADGEERFIVMDLVQGGTLRDWMETSRPWKEVVRMFMGAARGLQAAHDAGLVHRDFKPDNVLVEDELPRVVDFGLAAGADDSLATTSPADLGDSADPTLHTQTGAFVGTPVYMAPEQARGDATAASDQYAFCVALFEALQGRRPHAELESKGFEAMVIAREAPLPSGVPQGVPRWLRQVIARGLAPTPADRWPSMTELVSALRRVEDTRRRRTAVVAAGLGLTTMAAIVGSQWNESDTAADPCATAGAVLDEVWSDPKRAEIKGRFVDTGLPYAADTWNRVTPQLQAYAKQWAHAARRACAADFAAPAPTPPLNRARSRCIERRRSDFTSLLDTFARADSDTIDHAVDAAATIPPLSTCDDAALVQQQLERGQTHAVAPSSLYDRVAASDVAFRTGDDATAGTEARQALDAAASIPDHELAALASLVLAKVHRRAGEVETAATFAGDAVAAAERLGDTRLRAQAQLQLLTILSDLRDFDAATRQVRFIRASLGHLSDPPRMMTELQLLEGWLLQHKGELESALRRFEDAEALARAQDPVNSLQVGMSLSAQGTTLGELGRYEESVAVQRRAIEQLAARVGSATPQVIRARTQIAASLSNLGRGEDAIEEATGTVADADAVLGEESVLAARARATLALAYASQGKLTESESLLRAAAATLERKYGPKNPASADAWTNLGRVLGHAGKSKEAIEVLEHARTIMAFTLPPDHPDFIYIHTNLAGAHIELEQWQAAADAAQRAESIARRHVSTDNARLTLIQILRGSALRGAGQLDAAVELLRSVVAEQRAAQARPGLIADAEYELARTLEAQREMLEATVHMRAARALFQTDGAHKLRVVAIDDWLAEHGSVPSR